MPAWRGKSLKWRMQVSLDRAIVVVLVVVLILLCNMAQIPYG